jgi:hypothetical protein
LLCFSVVFRVRFQLRTYRDKFDEFGFFTRFPGVTSVSAVQNAAEWGAPLEAYIRSLPMVSKYYAILPARSYHMTLFGMHNQDGKDGQVDLVFFLRVE